MTKAYDKVPYDVLLLKLHGSGICGPAYSWFKSYLNNRKQIVQIEYYNQNINEIEKIRSEERHLTCSIPQGSVLGCVLYLIINDLLKCINNIELTLPVLFANDISILIKCEAKTTHQTLNDTKNTK